MEPTIPRESVILGTRIFRELNAGDIIVFRHDNVYMVKRIVAIPGETIKNDVTGKFVYVPENCYYVIGDSYSQSYDSRHWKVPYVTRKGVVAKLFIN